jgi:hypothetical protein
VSASLWGRINRGPYRWPIRLVALLLLGVALYAWFSRERAQNGLTVENRSGLPIEVLRLTVAGQRTIYRDVPPGGSVTAPGGGEGGDRFAVDGRLADGTMLRGEGGMPPGRALVVLPGGQILARPSGRAGPF